MGPTSLLARVLLWVGAIAASTAFWAFSAQQTMLDPSATRDLATDLIGADVVSESLAKQLSSQLRERVPAELASKVSDDELDAAASAAIADPRIADAFGDAIGSLHEQILNGGGDDKVTIDSGAINEALKEALQPIAPRLAKSIGGSDPIALEVDGARIPNLEAVDGAVGALLLAAALLALFGFGLGVVVHPQPLKAASIVGRRLVFISAVPVVLYLVVPAALSAIASDLTKLMSPFASAYGKGILPTALVLLVGGAVLWVGGNVARRVSLPGDAAQLPPQQSPRRGRVSKEVVRAPKEKSGRTDLRL